MNTQKILFLLPFVLTLMACPPIRECGHNFIYQGTIQTNDSILKDSLIIRFDNLGDIIFKMTDEWKPDTAIISANGSYKVVGDFLGDCSSQDKNIFEEGDNLEYKITLRGKTIQMGKFQILKLNKQYTDSAYLTIITLPTIEIN